jgi:hypothetical protein
MREAAQIDIEDVAPVKKPRARKAELVKIEKPATPANPVATTDTAAILGMIERIMVDPAASVERANQAFDFYLKVQADQARKAFDAAMADVRAEVKPIAKNRLVSHETKQGGTKTYRHEDLAEIQRTVDPILAQHGLSYRFRTTAESNQPVRVTCIVSHKLGYSEENTLEAGRDDTGNKNSLQAIGSTITYLQRYTLKAALGLAASNDDDGKAAGATEDDGPISEEQLAELIALADEVGADKAKFCKFAKVDSLADIYKSKFEKAKAALRNYGRQQ